MQQDEIYLIDIWRIFAREWKWFATALVVALAAAFAFTHLAKRQWEATAWIQIGQVGLAPLGQDPKIEPLQRVIERLQTVWFADEVLKSVGVPVEAPEARLYRKSLKIEPSPYAGLVKLSVRAVSPEQARLFAAATVTELQAIHRRISATPLKLAHARLDEIEGALQSALADRDRLLKLAAAGHAGGKGDPGPVFAGMLLAGKNEEIRGLQQDRADLTNRLGPSYTYETSLPWPIYLPDQQAYPNTVLIWGTGLLLGLGLGAFVAVLRNTARRASAR